MNDYNTIIATILAFIGGGGFLALIKWFNTKRSEKSMAALDVESKEVEVTKDRLDLVREYKENIDRANEKTIEMIQRNIDLCQQSSFQSNIMANDIRAIREQTADTNRRVSDIEDYLNGDFKKWKEEKNNQSV